MPPEISFFYPDYVVFCFQYEALCTHKVIQQLSLRNEEEESDRQKHSEKWITYRELTKVNVCVDFGQ